MYSTNDTEWRSSDMGNQWRRLNGKLLVVGKASSGGYWVSVSSKILKGRIFNSLSEAQIVAESHCAQNNMNLDALLGKYDASDHSSAQTK